MRYFLLAILLITGASTFHATNLLSEANGIINAGLFSAEDPEINQYPEGWRPMNFTGLKRTRYSLVDVDGITCVKAVSEQSSSGLFREIEIDIKEYPIMRWSWKTENIFEKGDVTKKDGDDYPARIYLMYDYNIHNLSWGTRQKIRILRAVYGRIPTRAVNYIWESKEPVGTVVPNPYSDLVTMVVVESGEENLGTWMHYERNVYEDYIQIFGEEPPKAGAIAIMTDSDDTGESAITWFGDITFHKSVDVQN